LQWAGKYRDFFVGGPYAQPPHRMATTTCREFHDWCGDLVAMLHEYRVKKKDLKEPWPG